MRKHPLDVLYTFVLVVTIVCVFLCINTFLCVCLWVGVPVWVCMRACAYTGMGVCACVRLPLARRMDANSFAFLHFSCRLPLDSSVGLHGGLQCVCLTPHACGLYAKGQVGFQAAAFVLFSAVSAISLHVHVAPAMGGGIIAREYGGFVLSFSAH